jgi:hypothetical protein
MPIPQIPQIPCILSVRNVRSENSDGNPPAKPDLVLIRRELRSDGVASLEVGDSYARDPIKLRPFEIPCHQESRARESDRSTKI